MGALSLSGFSQFYNIPATGSDTNTSCVGILRDPGGTGNYSSYANGFFVIDPPGSQPVQLIFTQFQTYNTYDYVRVYDGVGISGTLLGTYSGSTIPSPITSTTGAMTVRFYSDCCNFGTGFQATWTASGGSTPIAAFIASPTTVAFNSPVQFFTTSLYGGSYLWNFGDGYTSTLDNPSHSYTTAGSYTVKVIASNCTSSDTSNAQTITVGAAPIGTVSPDTLKISANCGSTANGSFTISNAAGGGSMNYALTLLEKNKTPILSESFENGLGSFTNQTPNVYTVTSKTNGIVPNGSKYTNVIGNGYYFDGIKANVNSSQPKEISYWVRTNSSSYSSTGTVTFGPANMTSSSTAMVYTYFYYGALRIYHKDNNGYYTNYNTNSVSGQWINVEYKNIDWSNKSFDIYVNNSLIVTGAKFLNNNLTGIGEVDASNYYYGNFDIDYVVIGDESVADAISFLPKAGTIGAGSSNVVSVSVNASGLYAGIYNLDFIIQSNDIALNNSKLPVVFSVVGDAILTSPTGCIQMDTLIKGQTRTDSVLVYNSGCDTLISTSITATDSDFSILSSSLNLLPDDSA